MLCVFSLLTHERAVYMQLGVIGDCIPYRKRFIGLRYVPVPNIGLILHHVTLNIRAIVVA